MGSEDAKHFDKPSVRLSIETDTRDPDKDVIPPWNARGKPFVELQEGDTVAHTFTRNGRHAGSCTQTRLMLLARHYQGADFAADVVSLLTRYAPHNRHLRDTQSRTSTRLEWCTPHSLTDALSSVFGLSHELFAHPLNHAPSIPNYWTPYRADEKFGARYDAYSWAWTGACYMNPEYSEDQLFKSIRWALEAVRQRQVPTFIVAVVPRDLPNDKRPWAYSRLLKDPQVTRLFAYETARTGKKDTKFSFLSPDEWATGHNTAGAPRFDTDVFLISNKEGFK
jgi:hypothetical protein